MSAYRPQTLQFFLNRRFRVRRLHVAFADVLLDDLF